MQGYNGWSYRPYKPLLWDNGDIYICRVVPGVDSIHLEWLDEGEAAYEVFFRERQGAEFILWEKTKKNESTVAGLVPNTDYEFYVAAGVKKSRIRLARCGESVGTTVNYLHSDDEAYAFSGRYLCSPSFVRHPEGYLLSSMDVYAKEYPQNLTMIFRSDDDGETWRYVSELMPCFWGKLFIHKNELYMLSCSTEYGDLLIGKSLDGGKTFSAPVCLLRGANGKNGSCGVHKNPQNMLYYKGRLYGTLEWGSWANKEYYHAAMVMSCDENADLMQPENWHFSEPVKYDPAWPGTVKGEALGTIEGTLCVAPDGELYNVMRYNIREAEPKHGLVLSYRVNSQDPDAPLQYAGAIPMPCNNSKFTIKYDPVSRKYYSVATRIDCDERVRGRNLLSLLASADMENWELVCDLLDRRNEDMGKVGFQYVDFEFEGDDLIYLCRTAINNAHSFHDSNYQTFHRIRNFRDL